MLAARGTRYKSEANKEKGYRFQVTISATCVLLDVHPMNNKYYEYTYHISCIFPARLVHVYSCHVYLVHCHDNRSAKHSGKLSENSPM